MEIRCLDTFHGNCAQAKTSGCFSIIQKPFGYLHSSLNVHFIVLMNPVRLYINVLSPRWQPQDDNQFDPLGECDGIRYYHPI